ncbi:hypothetical protein ID866_5738 [Astraeus odoratus]|nr:hypothetical protein ID866_5738 [Astraeus odoratus]
MSLSFSSSLIKVADWRAARRFCSRSQLFPRHIHYRTPLYHQGTRSASDKLFEDAVREEAEERDSATARGRNRLLRPENQHENWTGEESVQDVVLRMLVDKYKPLRTGIIRTADEKLKDTPPQINSGTTVSEYNTTRTWKEVANEPLLPAVEGHKPWHTTFKAPSHASASIKLGNFQPSSSSTRGGSIAADERTRRTERELLRRREQASRLTRARESTLDYRLGLRSAGDGRAAKMNPVTLKGWQSLVEDRIEKARIAGIFDKVKGRGQPITRPTDERNPFITREEFLMNRIVQRNGAAPPWVEVQIELESAANSFRETLRQSWTRRAVRMLTLSQPAAMLPDMTLVTVRNMRDREWEDRERSYHDTAIAELNSLVRKYNALAPSAVRRPYYTREVELERTYEDCAEDILCGVREKSRETPGHLGSRSKLKSLSGTHSPFTPGFSFGLRALVMQWIEWLRRKLTGTDQP